MQWERSYTPRRPPASEYASRSKRFETTEPIKWVFQDSESMGWLDIALYVLQYWRSRGIYDEVLSRLGGLRGKCELSACSMHRCAPIAELCHACLSAFDHHRRSLAANIETPMSLTTKLRCHSRNSSDRERKASRDVLRWDAQRCGAWGVKISKSHWLTLEVGSSGTIWLICTYCIVHV